MRRACEAAQLLGVDGDKTGLWREIEEGLPHWAGFRLENGEEILTDMAGVDPRGIPYNHFAGWIPVLLTDDINLDSSEEYKRLAMRTFGLVTGWHRGEIPYLIGELPDSVFEEKAWFHRMQDGDSVSDILKRGDAERLVQLIENEPERFLNSRSGVIHVFPAFRTQGEFEFRRFRARGGVEVSAEMMAGEVTYIRLESPFAANVRLLDPWNGEIVTLKLRKGRAVILRKPDGRLFS